MGQKYRSRSPRAPRWKQALFALLTVAGSVLLTAVAIEFVYRAFDTMKPQPFRKATKRLDYADTWRTNGLGPGGLLLEGFDAQVFDGYGGTVRWINNSQGFRSSREFAARPQSGTRRVLSIGDSFTAGYRVAQGRTYSDLIERNLGPANLEVLISCVESPHRGLDYLKKFGVQWNPHVVLLGITLGNDISQDYVSLHPEPIGFNHGLEFFHLPGPSLRPPSHGRRFDWQSFFRKRSWLWTDYFPPDLPIRASYGDDKLRLFDPWHGLGLFLKDPPAIIDEAYRRHFEVLSSLAEFCEARGIDFAVLLFPQRFQVQSSDWRATVESWGLNEAAFDLRRPNRLIREFCSRQGITVIDPVEHMTQEYENTRESAYLPHGDMHWNARGHELWFEGARADLADVLATDRLAGLLDRPD